MDELHAKISVLTDLLNGKGDDSSKFALNAMESMGITDFFYEGFQDSRGVFTRLYNDARHRLQRLQLLQQKKRMEVERLLWKIAKGMASFESAEHFDDFKDYLMRERDKS